MKKSPQHLTARIGNLQQRMAKWKVDAMLVTNRYDVRYLTGFIGEDSWALVPAGRPQVYVLSDFRFLEQIPREAPHVKAVMRKKTLGDELHKLVKRLKLEKIGLQVGHMTLAERKALKEKVGGKLLKPVDDELLMQRSVKDAGEIAAVEKAIAITEEAFRRTLRWLKPGQREIEVAAYLEYQMRKLGADGLAFPPIVAADANASLPHAIAGSARIRKGGLVLFDWGAIADGYCGDLTRAVFLGKPDPKLRKIYPIVLEAHNAGIAAIAPGKSLKKVDAVARRIIRDAGYDKQFGHSLGHGLGLLVHELPTLSRRSKGELKPGQIVTVEPGIYLPGVGGIRIESDVLVTESGHRVLSQLPTDLESAII